MKRFTGLLLGLGIGAILLIVGLLDGNTALYRPHWNPTVGEVVATEPAGLGASPALTRVWVEYTTAAGQVLTMAREFDLNRHPEFNLGNPVTVLYNEPNPLQHFIREPNVMQDALAVVAMVAGTGIIVGTLVKSGRSIMQNRPTIAAAA